MDSLGIAVIGAGGDNIASSRHLPALRLLPEARIVALHDVDGSAIARRAEQYGAAAYTDLEAMLARDDVDVVVVASPDSWHARHVVACAQAGKHILCEKPLCLTRAEAAAMQAAVHSAGVRFGAAQSQRYMPAALRARDLIRAGEIGDPVYGSYVTKGRFFSYPPGSEYRRAHTGGQFLHNGPHYVDLLVSLLGSLPTRVYAQSLAHYPTEDRLETDNLTVAMLGFASGAFGRVEQSLVMLDPPGFPARDEVRIVGTRGTLLYGTALGGTLEVFGPGGWQETQPCPATPDDDGFLAMHREFLQALLRDDPPPIPPEHSWRVLETCLATLESCASGEPVVLGGEVA